MYKHMRTRQSTYVFMQKYLSVDVMSAYLSGSRKCWAEAAPTASMPSIKLTTYACRYVCMYGMYVCI